MAYTPRDQELKEPLAALIEASEELKQRMTNRLRDRREWKEEHITELEAWVERLTKLEIDAMRLKEQVR